MSLDVVVYRAGREWTMPWEDVFIAGLRAHGIEAEQRPQAERRVSDLAVIWAHRQRPLFEAQRAAGKHYLVMERGYIGDRQAWTSLGFDGLNGRAKFPPATDGGARWDRLFAQYMMKGWRMGGEYALLCGQVPGDASIRDHDHIAWLHQQAAALEARGWLVRFRPHPLTLSAPPETVYGPFRDISVRSLSEDLGGAEFVVTYSSNASVDAMLAGLPVVAADPGSMVWDIAGHDIDDIRRPDRTEWAHAMAFRQWNEAEIASGEAWENLKACICALTIIT